MSQLPNELGAHSALHLLLVPWKTQNLFNNFDSVIICFSNISKEMHSDINHSILIFLACDYL